MIQIVGRVDSDGEAILGEGFTCEALEEDQNKKLHYKVTFSQDIFFKPPVILVTAEGTEHGNNYTAVVAVHDVSTEEFRVEIQKNSSAEFIKCAFNFLAMGN